MQISSQIGSSPGIQTDVPVVRAKSPSVELPAFKSADNVKVSVDPEVLRAATDKINQTMESLGNNLQFTVDTETSMNIVKVVDRATNETIRQFPSEETLAIAKTLDKLQGLLIRATA